MNFQKELEELLNKWSMENGSNTPDFILAQFLMDCLRNYERTVASRLIFFATLDEDLPDPRSPTLREADGDTCPRCEGTGTYERLGYGIKVCSLCNGTGHV